MLVKVALQWSFNFFDQFNNKIHQKFVFNDIDNDETILSTSVWIDLTSRNCKNFIKKDNWKIILGFVITYDYSEINYTSATLIPKNCIRCWCNSSIVFQITNDTKEKQDIQTKERTEENSQNTQDLVWSLISLI